MGCAQNKNDSFRILADFPKWAILSVIFVREIHTIMHGNTLNLSWFFYKPSSFCFLFFSVDVYWKSVLTWDARGPPYSSVYWNTFSSVPVLFANPAPGSSGIDTLGADACSQDGRLLLPTFAVDLLGVAVQVLPGRIDFLESGVSWCQYCCACTCIFNRFMFHFIFPSENTHSLRKFGVLSSTTCWPYPLAASLPNSHTLASLLPLA